VKLLTSQQTRTTCERVFVSGRRWSKTTRVSVSSEQQQWTILSDTFRSFCVCSFSHPPPPPPSSLHDSRYPHSSFVNVPTRRRSNWHHTPAWDNEQLNRNKEYILQVGGETSWKTNKGGDGRIALQMDLEENKMWRSEVNGPGSGSCTAVGFSTNPLQVALVERLLDEITWRKWKIYSNDKLRHLVLPASKQTHIPECQIRNRNVTMTSRTCYGTATKRREDPSSLPVNSKMCFSDDIIMNYTVFERE
jgi:hypothetical protein